MPFLSFSFSFFFIYLRVLSSSLADFVFHPLVAILRSSARSSVFSSFLQFFFLFLFFLFHRYFLCDTHFRAALGRFHAGKHADAGQRTRHSRLGNAWEALKEERLQSFLASIREINDF